MLGALIFATVAMISLLTGRYGMSFRDYIDVIGNLIGYILRGDKLETQASIVVNIRMPRVIMAGLIGAGLSISGLIFQTIFKNPIASPDILGVTSGASFGAALGLMLPISIVGIVQLLAFVFGLLAIGITYMIRTMSKDKSILYLVLSGIITSAFFTSLLSIMKYLADPYEQLSSIVFWTMGGLHNSNWQLARYCIIIIIPMIIVVNKLQFKVSILSLSDDEAISLGLDVNKFRNIMLVLVSFIVSFCVSISGTISWIALIIPHLARLLVSVGSKKIYIFTALLGATVLIFLDSIARTLTTSEIPIGILTAIVGAPMLGYLIIFKKTV